MKHNISYINYYKTSGLRTAAHTIHQPRSQAPQCFNVHQKWGRGGGNAISHDKCWHDVMKDRQPTTVDFESVHQLQFIKHSYLRPSRILLHPLEGFGTISFIHVELEQLKYGSPTCNFHDPPPFQPQYVGLHVHCIPGSPSFLCTLKRLGSPEMRVTIHTLGPLASLSNFKQHYISLRVVHSKN